MKFIFGLIFSLTICSVDIYASEIYSLDKAKEEVSKNNINIAIAYEQYVQVKNEEQSKAFELLPSFSIDMLVLKYQYTILRNLIPEPSRFFELAAQKDLANAAVMNKIIVKNNLIEDLEKTMFLFQFHNQMVSSFKKEAEISKEISIRSKEAYDLGVIDFTEYFRTQRNVFTTQTQLVNGNELIQSEGFALKLILQFKDNTEKLNIDKIDFYNSGLDFPSNAKDAAEIAVNYSPEVDQFDELIRAAKNQKRGVAISWLSWGGVGFDLFSKISIAKAEVKIIELTKQKTIFGIKNQVIAQYSIINSQKEKIRFQNILLDMAKSNYSKALASQGVLLGSFIETKKSEMSLTVAERELLKLNYELEIQFLQLKRLLGADMMTNVVPKA